MRGGRHGGGGEQRHLSCTCCRGLLVRAVQGGFPESGGAATFAKADNAVVGGADVGFDAGVVDFFESVAGTADDRDEAHFYLDGTDGRKVDFPEIEMGIEEGNAIGVLAGLLAEVADDADFGFAIFLGPAKDELLLGRKFVAAAP